MNSRGRSGEGALAAEQVGARAGPRSEWTAVHRGDALLHPARGALPIGGVRGEALLPGGHNALERHECGGEGAEAGWLMGSG